MEMIENRKKYTKEFKLDAVRMLETGEKAGPVLSTVDLADIRGFISTSLVPSGAFLSLGSRILTAS